LLPGRAYPRSRDPSLGSGVENLMDTRILSRRGTPEKRAPEPRRALSSYLSPPPCPGCFTVPAPWARSAARQLVRRSKETQMHALVVRVTIHTPDRTREVLNGQVVPQMCGAPGFKTGYWTWSTGSGETNGLSMIIYDSEEHATAAGERVKEIAATAPDDVTLEGTEVREVVASA